MAIKNSFPNVKPTADFNFAATKKLDQRIAFSRGSAAAYYDGKTLAKAEENLWVGSTTIGNQSLALKTDSAATTPGGYSACLLIPNTTSDWHAGGYQSRYLAADLDYVWSFVCKPSGYSKIRFGDTSTNRYQGTVDLTTATVSGTGGPLFVSATATALSDGFVRIVIKLRSIGASVMSAMTVTPFPDGATVDTYGRANFAGDGTSGAIFGEFQLEQRAAFSFHVPTTTAAVTNWQPALLSAPSGMPRFQHDPVSGKSLGYLSERQMTNLLAESEFYNGIQTAGGVTLGKMFSPSGEVANAAVFAPGATTKFLYPKTSLTVSASTVYAVSVFVKMDDGLAPAFGHAMPANAANDFYLGVGNTSIDPTTYRVQNVGNGLYRVSGSVTTGTVNLGNHYIYRYSTNSGRGFRVTGWQIEAHTRATSYIKTEGSQVTRLADNATIEGAALDSFYNQRGGTFVATAIVGFSPNTAQVIFGMDLGASVSNRFNAYVSSGPGAVIGNYVNNAASGAPLVSAGLISDQVNSLAVRFADNDFAACANGGQVGVSAGSLGVKTKLGIGCVPYAANDRLDSPLMRLAYFDELLSNGHMQALTRI